MAEPKRPGRPSVLVGDVTTLRVRLGESEREALELIQEGTGETASEATRQAILERAERIRGR